MVLGKSKIFIELHNIKLEHKSSLRRTFTVAFQGKNGVFK